MFEEHVGDRAERVVIAAGREIGGRDDSGGDVTHVSRDWHEIDRDMRRLAARRAALDVEEARMLLEAKRAELHKHLGYGSFAEYLERALGSLE